MKKEVTRKPTFFIVGGSRCGTTSLHRVLAHHPGIFLPREKSPNYFTAEDMADFPEATAMAAMKSHLITDQAEYLNLFASATDEQLLGEVSPVYLQSIHTAARIAAFAPKAKIVAILRNPVDRAFSHYIGRRRDGLETRTSFKEVIASELADREPKLVAFNHYLAIGRYGFFLKSFCREFPSEQIKLLFFDDLVHNPAAVLQDLFAFLGVEQLDDQLPLEQKNRGGIIQNPLLRNVWTRTALSRARFRKYLPARARDLVGRVFLSKIHKPSLDPEIRNDLIEYFADDLRDLEALCESSLADQYDFSQWRQANRLNYQGSNE